MSDSPPERWYFPQWRGWVLEPSTNTIWYPYNPARLDAGELYEVGLETCLTSAGVLDWIMQVAKKSWATDSILAGLVRCLNDALDPQAKLCSWGVDHPLSLDEVKQLASKNGLIARMITDMGVKISELDKDIRCEPEQEGGSDA